MTSQQRFTPPPNESRLENVQFVYLEWDGDHWQRSIHNRNKSAPDLDTALADFWTDMDPDFISYLGAMTSGQADQSSGIYVWADQFSLDVTEYEQALEAFEEYPGALLPYTVWGQLDHGDGPRQLIEQWVAKNAQHAELLYRDHHHGEGDLLVGAVFRGRTFSIDFNPDANYTTMSGYAAGSAEENELRRRQQEGGAAVAAAHQSWLTRQNPKEIAAGIALLAIILTIIFVLI